MNKYAMYIRKVLSARDLAEQLAEECSELAKASLKMIRAGGMSANITPITRREAYDNFVEEQKDVISVLWLLTMDERMPILTATQSMRDGRNVWGTRR